MTVFEVQCEIGGYYPDNIYWPTCEDPQPPLCSDYPPAPTGVPISIVNETRKPQPPGGSVLYSCTDPTQTSTLGDTIEVFEDACYA